MIYINGAIMKSVRISLPLALVIPNTITIMIISMITEFTDSFKKYCKKASHYFFVMNMIV